MTLLKSWSIFMMGSTLIFMTMTMWILMSEKSMMMINTFFTQSNSLIYSFKMDWVSMTFTFVVIFISMNVLYFSISYMKMDNHIKRFTYLVMTFIFSMVVLITSSNMISMVFGWDGLGLSSYLLVIYYQNKKSYNAGTLTILSNRVGDVWILLTISFMMLSGSWESQQISNNTITSTTIFLASITKSAQIPFSAWLPAAMSAPTPVSSLVHSSTLVTAGVYLLIRFDSLVKEQTQFILMMLSIITLMMAGISACQEMDLKKVVALSTLSQLAMMMIAISMKMWEIAMFHMMTHALFKALLFLATGTLMHNFSSSQDMRKMGNMSKFTPIAAMGVIISSMNLFGLPFMSGFYSKDLIIEMSFMMGSNLPMTIMFMGGVMMTIIYMTRFWTNAFTQMYSFFPLNNFGEDKFLSTSIKIMSISAITGGNIMQWMLFNSQFTLVLPKIMKLFSIYSLGLALWVKKIMKTKHPMWFISWISSFFIMNIKSKTSNWVLQENLWINVGNLTNHNMKTSFSQTYSMWMSWEYNYILVFFLMISTIMMLN